MPIDVPLLVVGRGPAALVVAKLAAGRGLPCLLAGHEIVGDEVPRPLTAPAAAVLERDGLLDVLRPHLTAVAPLTIAPSEFELVVKHHCVADLNVTVYDGVTVLERVTSGAGLRGVLSDGTSRWLLHADRFVDADALPSALSAAIVAGAARVDALLGAPDPGARS
jgi:hypothetical protein